MLFKFTVVSLFLSISLLGNSSFGAISTGQKTGTYFKIGNDISTVFKKYKATLKVIPSKGSIENLDALTGKNEKSGAKWAIIQNDALNYYKFLHFKKTKEEITNKIKTVLPLYNEHIHIFAKKGKKINFKKGAVLKVGISSETSGSYITAKILENAYKVNFQYNYVNLKTAFEYLQEDKLDIVIDLISYPYKSFKDLKDVTLVNLPKNKLMNKNYIRAKFSKVRYPWLEKDIHSYKVPSVLVTNRVDKKYDQTVGIFLKIILNNYKALIKYAHPKWKEGYRTKTLEVDNMHPVAYKILHR